MNELIRPLMNSILFSVIGVLAFAIAFVVILKASPFSVRKEIEEDHNVALAIIIASVILGIAIIVAAAIHG
jgi:uncharacterized membrane protein YjfL (UPF0719 family)